MTPGERALLNAWDVAVNEWKEQGEPYSSRMLVDRQALKNYFITCYEVLGPNWLFGPIATAYGK